MSIPEDNYLTFTLLAFITLVSLLALRDKNLFYRLVFHPASVIQKKEYHRIITSGWVHNDFVHLTLNMFMLYVFCSGLEETKPGPGPLGVLAIVGNSLIGGHLLSLWINRRDLSYSCAGASGMVFGCLCAFLILRPFDEHLNIPVVGPIPNIYTAVVYLALILIYRRKFKEVKIDYVVHFGGAVGGILTTLFLYQFLLRL